MRQFLIRISFILSIFILYIIGAYLSSLIEYQIDFSKLLPFISLAFYDYWLMLLDKDRIELDVVNKIQDRNGFIFDILIKYTGNLENSVSINKFHTYGFNKSDIYMLAKYFSSQNKEIINGNLGQNLTILSKINPWVNIEIDLLYKRQRELDSKNQFRRINYIAEKMKPHIKIVVISFNIGNHSKKKYIIF